MGAKAEASLYASIIDGQLEVADLGITDWQRIQDLVSTYADLRLGGTDASVVALAERHGAVKIAEHPGPNISQAASHGFLVSTERREYARFGPSRCHMA